MNAQVEIESVGEINSLEEKQLDHGEQYLTFVLGNESYAINILSVKEISGWYEATLIPNSPDYVKGVVNMRGTIVPIVDLRSRFKVGDSTYLPTTVVIIMTGDAEIGKRTVGFIVDAVSDVLDVKLDEMKPSSEFDGTVPSEFISGMVNTSNHVVTVLDVNKLITIDD